MEIGIRQFVYMFPCLKQRQKNKYKKSFRVIGKLRLRIMGIIFTYCDQKFDRGDVNPLIML